MSGLILAALGASPSGCAVDVNHADPATIGSDAARSDAPDDADATEESASRHEAVPSTPRTDVPGGPGYDWKPGDYPPDVHEQTYLEIAGVPGQQGKTRGYKVHVPPGYTSAKAAPVLFAMHGYFQNAVMFVVDGTSLLAKSDDEGFILVMPNGLQEDLFGGSWNGGVCCGEASKQRLDDVALIRAIFAEVAKHVHIDTTRVYATGLSNGGFLSYRIACEASDLFVAVAPIAGAIGSLDLGNAIATTILEGIGTNPSPDLESCEPKYPVAVLSVHGTADPLVPYESMKPSVDHFARVNRCEASVAPAAQPMSGGDTTCVTYTGCPMGVAVTACTIRDGGHCWFGDASCGTGAPIIGNLFVGNDSTFFKTSDAVWDFLKRFHR
jgi:polyhydroxybutyrate depolymerase